MSFFHWLKVTLQWRRKRLLLIIAQNFFAIVPDSINSFFQLLHVCHLYNEVDSAFWLVSAMINQRTDAQMTTAFISSLTALRFLWTKQNALICKATNEFASFCIDEILHQNGFFHGFWNEQIRCTIESLC